MTALLEKSIAHERHTRKHRRRNRSGEIATELVSRAVGPGVLSVRMNADCKTESERLGYLRAAYSELWRAYWNLAVEHGRLAADDPDPVEEIAAHEAALSR